MFCRCKPLWDLLRIFPNTLCRAHVRWEWGSPWVTHSATAPDGNVSVTLFFYSKLVLVGGKIKQTHTQQQHFRFHPCRANNRRQHSSTARRLRRRQGTARGDRSGGPGLAHRHRAPGRAQGVSGADRNRGCPGQGLPGNINRGAHSFRRAAPVGGSNQHPFPPTRATYTSYIYTYRLCVIYTPCAGRGRWKCMFSPLDVTPPHHSPGFWGDLGARLGVPGEAHEPRRELAGCPCPRRLPGDDGGLQSGGQGLEP